jgi:hypothetical protein
MTPAPEELFEIIQSVDTYLMALAVTPDPRAKRAARTILRVWRSITRPLAPSALQLRDRDRTAGDASHKVAFEHLPDFRVSHGQIGVVPQHVIEFFIAPRR